MTDMIYGEYADYLPLILEDFSQRIRKKNDEVKKRLVISCLNILSLA